MSEQLKKKKGVTHTRYNHTLYKNGKRLLWARWGREVKNRVMLLGLISRAKS